MDQNLAALLVLVAVLIASMAGVSVYIYYGRLIMRSRVAGVPIGFGQMLAMTFSGLNAHALVTAYLDAHNAGIPVTLDQLEAHARARGNLRTAVEKLKAAKKSGVAASIEEVLAAERAPR